MQQNPGPGDGLWCIFRIGIHRPHCRPAAGNPLGLLLSRKLQYSARSEAEAGQEEPAVTVFFGYIVNDSPNPSSIRLGPRITLFTPGALRTDDHELGNLCLGTPDGEIWSSGQSRWRTMLFDAPCRLIIAKPALAISMEEAQERVSAFPSKRHMDQAATPVGQR
jgi:hypothetical protein